MLCARRRSGFTLIELLVVVGILAILMGILIPMISRTREASRRTKCMSNLRNIGHGLARYIEENKGMYPRTLFDPDQAWFGFVSAMLPSPFLPPAAKNDPVASMFLLVRTGHVQAADFICPSTDDVVDDFEGKKPEERSNFTNPMTPANSDLSRGWTNRSYSYSAPFPTREGVEKGIRMTAATTPAGFAVIADFGGFPRPADPNALRCSTDGGRKGNSLNHKQDGQNVLYNDGSVQWSISNRCGIAGDNIYISRNGGQTTDPSRPEDPADSCMDN